MHATISLLANKLIFPPQMLYNNKPPDIRRLRLHKFFVKQKNSPTYAHSFLSRSYFKSFYPKARRPLLPPNCFVFDFDHVNVAAKQLRPLFFNASVCIASFLYSIHCFRKTHLFCIFKVVVVLLYLL